MRSGAESPCLDIRVIRWIEGWRLVPSEAEFDDVGSAVAV